MHALSCTMILRQYNSEPLRKLASDQLNLVKTGTLKLSESSYKALKADAKTQFDKLITVKPEYFSAARERGENVEIINTHFPDMFAQWEKLTEDINKALTAKLGQDKGPRLQPYIRGEGSRNK